MCLTIDVSDFSRSPVNKKYLKENRVKFVFKDK